MSRYHPRVNLQRAALRTVCRVRAGSHRGRSAQRVVPQPAPAPGAILWYSKAWHPAYEVIRLEWGSLIPEAIIVAGGGVIAGDDGRGVEEERAEVVNAAAHSFAVRPAVFAVAAAGHVVVDIRSADDHGAGRDISAAAGTVAAIAAVAARGLVVVEGGIRNDCRNAGDMEAAAEAITAVGATRAVTAEGLVVRE